MFHGSMLLPPLQACGGDLGSVFNQNLFTQFLESNAMEMQRQLLYTPRDGKTHPREMYFRGNFINSFFVWGFPSESRRAVAFVPDFWETYEWKCGIMRLELELVCLSVSACVCACACACVCVCGCVPACVSYTCWMASSNSTRFMTACSSL